MKADEVNKMTPEEFKIHRVKNMQQNFLDWSSEPGIDPESLTTMMELAVNKIRSIQEGKS